MLSFVAVSKMSRLNTSVEGLVTQESVEADHAANLLFEGYASGLKMRALLSASAGSDSEKLNGEILTHQSKATELFEELEAMSFNGEEEKTLEEMLQTFASLQNGVTKLLEMVSKGDKEAANTFYGTQIVTLQDVYLSKVTEFYNWQQKHIVIAHDVGTKVFESSCRKFVGLGMAAIGFGIIAAGFILRSAVLPLPETATVL